MFRTLFIDFTERFVISIFIVDYFYEYYVLLYVWNNCFSEVPYYYWRLVASKYHCVEIVDDNSGDDILRHIIGKNTNAKL